MARIEDLPDILAYQMGRRSMLEHMGLIAAAGVAGGFALEATQIPAVRPQPKAFAPPEKIFPGLVAINKDSIPRNYPAIPFGRIPGLRRFSPNNRIPWSEIDAINGVDVQGFYTTIVRNPVVVDGQDVRRNATPNSHSDWLRLQLGLKNGTERTGFVNFTWDNIDYVRPIAPMYPGSMRGVLQHDGTFVINTPDVQGKFEIGETFPVVEFVEDIWNKYTAAKLEGRVPLDIGERKYSDAAIVPDYRDCKLEEDVRRTSDVEALYGTPFPIALAREARKPVGFAPWDTKIKTIVATGGFADGLTLRKFVDNDIFDKDGRPITIPDNKVIRLEAGSFSKPKELSASCKTNP